MKFPLALIALQSPCPCSHSIVAWLCELTVAVEMQASRPCRCDYLHTLSWRLLCSARSGSHAGAGELYTEIRQVRAMSHFEMISCKREADLDDLIHLHQCVIMY